MTIELYNTLKEKTIKIYQNGRYIEFYKRGSPYIYKIDLVEDSMFCEQRSTGEVYYQDSRAKRRWFDNKLVTEDEKIANMFRFACFSAGRRAEIDDILRMFCTSRMHTYEKWLSIDTHFNRRIFAWGNENRETDRVVEYEPNVLSREMREYVKNKSWGITELNQFCYNFEDYKDNRIINQIFEEMSKHMEYVDAFILLDENGGSINQLHNSNCVRALATIMENYNMDADRTLYYINYLHNVEYVQLVQHFGSWNHYLENELERNQGRKNRMYKFPNNFHTTLHKDAERVRREHILENYHPDNDAIYDNEYLEYEDDDFKMIIPRSPADVKNEGRQQGHCVATHFMNYIANGDTAVVFMRRTTEPEKALITIEVRNNKIRQASIGNNNSVPDEYRDWIRNWASMKGVEIDEEDSWSTGRAF